ncbi:WecB/TagA/CpsF family glycosyltransferase [Arthrobacter alpinus]|nr:WecB/TagA/CpsF family glycosyltransferase [Arthrobacter alpinus]
MTQAIDLLNTTVESGEAGYVCVSDVNAVLHASRNPDLKRIFNNSLLTVPDGIPLVWAGRRAGAKWMSRVSGPDLMPALLRSAAQKGWSSYFMGAQLTSCPVSWRHSRTRSQTSRLPAGVARLLEN